MENEVRIKIDTTGIDEAQKKANQLVETLAEAQRLIDLLARAAISH